MADILFILYTLKSITATYTVCHSLLQFTFGFTAFSCVVFGRMV